MKATITMTEEDYQNKMVKKFNDGFVEGASQLTDSLEKFVSHIKNTNSELAQDLSAGEVLERCSGDTATTQEKLEEIFD